MRSMIRKNSPTCLILAAKILVWISNEDYETDACLLRYFEMICKAKIIKLVVTTNIIVWCLRVDWMFTCFGMLFSQIRLLVSNIWMNMILCQYQPIILMICFPVMKCYFKIRLLVSNTYMNMVLCQNQPIKITSLIPLPINFNLLFFFTNSI